MEKIWHWPLQASPHDMTKMIQTFHQISGQLGCKSKGMRSNSAPLKRINYILWKTDNLAAYRGKRGHIPDENR